nr:insulinase family protein [Desulfovibrio sp.]
MNNPAFILIAECECAEVSGAVRLWKHAATGTQVLSIVNSDENKCFGVAFRTPPKDSTGVAHIIEHSVLCGSEKYPVKEPFVNLLKGSLQTFLNAFTFPDKTCYPVASANLQDFYNLIDVYLDAVFHPRISENSFRQEGWHVEADTPDGAWSYKGVVYNEMKGVYSSPDSCLAEESQHAMFPDTLYSLDSGGRPAEIPNLTYEAYRDFHASYYHPSNARFFFWGD